MTAADVTRLKCIVFGANLQIVEASNYGIKCNTTLLNETIDRGQFLLDLYNLSPTLCKSLECAILAFNESKVLYCVECSSPCVRDVAGIVT